MKIKLFNLTQYFFLLCVLSFFAYWVYCLTYPYKIVDIYSATTIGENLIVGQPLTYKVKYCKYMDISPTVYRELVDGVIYSLNATSARTPMGCNEVIMYAGYVPDVASGKYVLKMKNVYQVNPFREIIVEFQTNKFTIISNE